MLGAHGGVRRQFGGILVSRAVGSALQAVAVILLARSVSPAQFGVVSVVIAVVGFALVVTGLGMSIFVPWARARGEDDDVVCALYVNTWSNIVSAAVFVAGIAWWAVSSSQPLALALIGVSLALERNADTWIGVPIADGDSRVAVRSVIIRRTVCLSVMVPLLLAGGDPVLAFTGGLTVGAVAGQIHVRRTVRSLGGVSPRGRVLAVVRRALPFLVSNVTGQARTLDVTLVGAVAGPVAAGVYAAVTKLVQPALLVPQALASVLVPHATRLDLVTARRLGSRIFAVLAACAVLATPVVVWREELVVFVLGGEYQGAGPTFVAALAAVGFIAWAVTVGAVLQGQGRQRLVAWLGSVFAVVVLGGVALGAHLAGAFGAALGLSAGWLAYGSSLGLILAFPGRLERRRPTPAG